MIASTLLASLLLLPQDRVRQELPNGALYLIDKADTPGHIRVALSASSHSHPDEPATLGVRHLLEHLVVKGRDRGLDRRLESKGVSLSAWTTRDALNVVISGPAEALSLAMSAMEEVLSPGGFTQEEIAKEIKIMAEEKLLHAPERPLVDAAWEAVYGQEGLSPFGDLEALAKLTPSDLEMARQRIFAPAGLSLAVLGEVDPGVARLRCQEILGKLSGWEVSFDPRMEIAPGSTPMGAPASGEARAVLTAGVTVPVTLAMLGFALAQQRDLPGTKVFYDTSAWDSVIIWTAPQAGQLDALDKLTEEDVVRLAPFVRGRAAQWALGLTIQDDAHAALRAKLLRQARTFDLNQLYDTARGLTDQEIVQAWQRWIGPKSYRVRGMK